MIFSLDRIFENNMSLKYKNEFIKNYQKYIFTFTEWKRREGLIMAREPIKTYIQLKQMNKSLDEDNEQFLHNKQIMNKLRENIYMLAGKEGIKCMARSLIPVFNDEKIFNDIEKTVKRAFWDVFQDNIKNKKFEHIIHMLSDVKNLLNEIVATSDMEKELNEYLDIEYLNNIVKNDNIDMNNIKTYEPHITYIINKIKSIQAPADDDDTNLFEQNIKNKITNNEQLDTILVYFFKTTFEKLEKINDTTKKFREAINLIKGKNKNKN